MSIRLDEIRKKPEKGIRLDQLQAPRGVRLDELRPEKGSFLGGLWRGVKTEPTKALPFFGGLISIEEASSIIAAGKRIQSNEYEEVPFFGAAETEEKYSKLRQYGAWVTAPTKLPKWTPEIQHKHDIRLIENYFEKLATQEAEAKKYGTGYTVGRILSGMPSFMIEFAATGGLQTLGSKLAKQTGKKLLGRYAATKAGKAALATGGFAVGTAARAAGMPHRAAEAILKRQIPQDIKITDKGVEVVGPVEKPYTSIYKGLLDHYTEIASEQAGEYIAPIISKGFTKLPFFGKIISKIQQRWLKLNPEKSGINFANKIKSAVGFHGVIAEIGEEYLGDITRAITDVEHFGAGEDAGVLERISAAVAQDTRNLPAMAIAFAVPGVMGKAVSKISQRQIDKIEKREKFKKELNRIRTLETETPTQIETAEGIIGFEDDFEIEKYEKIKPKYEFEAPGYFTWSTPKWLINRLMGVETLLEDVEAAELARQVEKRDLLSWVSKINRQIKKQRILKLIPERLEEEAKREAIITGVKISKTRAARLRRKIEDRNPIHIMRDLLDTYEEAPDFLDAESTRTFNQVRELTRYMRQRANMVREKMGLPPIKYVEGYITHWFDTVSQQIVNKDVPVHSGFLYYLMKDLPKKVKNPTQMKRIVHGKLTEYFSKDLGKLLRTMIAYDLKDIYITEPYMAAWEELKRLRQEKEIPRSVFNEVEKYLEYDIRKFKTPLDEKFNKTLKKPTDFINTILVPFGKTITDPSRNLLGGLRQMAHISGLAGPPYVGRPKTLTRNLGQRLLLLDFYRPIDYSKAQMIAFGLAKMPTVKHPITGEDIRLIDYIREQDWYKVALNKFADFDSKIRGIQQSVLKPYSRTHIGSQFISNVEVSAFTGYLDWLHNYQLSKDVNSKHFKNCVEKAKELGIPTQELLTQESDMNWNLRESVRRTQWEYMSISMPTWYRGEFKRVLGIFQSWWMNYFFNHGRECINQVVTGRNSKGRLLTPGGRLRALKGTGTIVGIAKIGKSVFKLEMLKYLFLPFPGYLPPIVQLTAGILEYLAADDDKERKRAAAKVKYGLKFWIPFSAFLRDANRLFSGEYDIWDFLFYRKKKK